MRNDPYKYFRIEARDILEGLTQGVLQQEKGSAAPDGVARLLRLAHTLKGAARVVKQPGIAELAHTIEGVLAGHRESGRPLSKEQGNELLRLFDEITSLLQRLGPAAAPTSAGPAQPVAEEPPETVRVEIQAMDSLHRGVTEAAVQLGAVRKSLAAADHLRDLTNRLVEQLAGRSGENGTGAAPAAVRAQSLAEQIRSSLERFQRGLEVDIDRVHGEFLEILDIAHRLRLIPAHSVFPSLDRAVRDAAQALGKRVDFETSGGDVRLDANVLASLRDALMHVVRNAVAHGAQTEAERLAAGKPPVGHVRLAVERRGARVAFVCTDDGRGIDVEGVRKAAVSRGLVSASEARSLAPERVIALLRAGGLTTSGNVTEWSGRGIGLDVVRASASRLKGELSIRSEAGQGAAVEIQVPVSLASLQGLVVEVGAALAAIPLDAVRQTLRVRNTDISRGAERETILHDGKVVPFVPLNNLLQSSGSPASSRRVWTVVLVEDAGSSVAVGVDRLLGTSSIVIRSLPGAAQAEPVVSGASLDAAGNPQLVLDPGGLVAAGARGRDVMPEPAAPVRAPILIVDDSLTTRMLEQSILESAGYEVELAVSAEEALSKSRDRRYSLFIVDVEMPGMDGFEFVAHARADAALRDIPAILVTSRSAVEDRRRGEQVGARAYIVKGEFDQGKLLQTIRALGG
jgi:two-component system chemotaxis sensor kinase CheA